MQHLSLTNKTQAGILFSVKHIRAQKEAGLLKSNDTSVI